MKTKKLIFALLGLLLFTNVSAGPTKVLYAEFSDTDNNGSNETMTLKCSDTAPDGAKIYQNTDSWKDVANEVKDVGTYFSIIKVIAAGASKLSEMSEKLNVKQTGLTNYLKTLIEIEILRREVPITETNPEKSKKSIYKINDNFIRFWFRFIYPNRDQIEMGNTEYVLNLIKRNFVDNHVSYVYEDVCREMMICDKKIHVDKVGKWWDKEDEIDVVGIDNDSKILYVGECKFTNKKVGMQVLYDLKRKAEKIKEYSDYKKVYCLFSINGYEKELLKGRNNDIDILLK